MIRMVYVQYVQCTPLNTKWLWSWIDPVVLQCSKYNYIVIIKLFSDLLDAKNP